jgi:hypothetical protein
MSGPAFLDALKTAAADADAAGKLAPPDVEAEG